MRAAFFTLGCKVNQYETAALQQAFAADGYDIVEPEADAEVYVVNSCTVTAEGDRKSRQMLRRFKRRNPAAAVCLTGCFPQAFPDAALRIPEADVITGSKNRAGLLGAVRKYFAEGEQVVDVSPYQSGEAFEPMRAGFPARARAFVKIQDGCDRHCAYCIIPRARGPVRSKPPEELRAELTSLAGNGYREVVLAGINLSSYGRGLGLRLTDAVCVACGIPGLDRVRIGSLEPELLAAEDIAALAELPQLCPHFHLSLQSGCGATLRRMRRPYGPGEYREIAGALRARFPGCALTTDIMVGFPGETEEEFAESLVFAGEMGFARAHVFAFSPRPGTAAAELPDQVPRAVKTLRARGMAEAMRQSRARFLEAQAGGEAEVLFEQEVGPGIWEGYAANYTPVTAPGTADLAGTLRRVCITGTDGERCTGVLL